MRIKRSMLIVVGMLFLFTTVGCNSSGPAISGLPYSSKVIPPSLGDITITHDPNCSTFLVGVPIDSTQRGTPPVIYWSNAQAQGSSWLRSADDHRCELSEISSRAIVDLELPVGVHRVRLWGVTGESWMFISQTSIYYRLGADNKPAYEFIVNVETGEKSPVPKKYEAWK